MATLQTLVRGAKPRSRQQIANRFARLESERARLEREITIWESCREAAAARLAKARSEIDSLRSMLQEPRKKKVPAMGAWTRRRGKASFKTAGPPAVARRTIDLTY